MCCTARNHQTEAKDRSTERAEGLDESDVDDSNQPSDAIEEGARRSRDWIGMGTETTVVAPPRSKAGRERPAGSGLAAATDDGASDAHAADGVSDRADRRRFSPIDTRPR